MTTGPKFLDTLQAAREAGKCPETIRRWVRSGRLRAYRTRHNTRMYFHLSDIQGAVQKEEIGV